MNVVSTGQLVVDCYTMCEGTSNQKQNLFFVKCAQLQSGEQSVLTVEAGAVNRNDRSVFL